jgi:hypothetical protein
MEKNIDKYPIKQKAWTLDHEAINEAWNYGREFTVYAETKNKAKSKLIKEFEYEDMTLYKNDDPVTYLNIPVERDEHHDLLEFEDSELTLFKINEILEERERIEEIDVLLKDETITYVYIKKRGSFYSKNWSGYSSYVFRAGVYKKEEAASHARSCTEISIVPCNISKHNRSISKEINRLKEMYSQEERSLKSFLVEETEGVS